MNKTVSIDQFLTQQEIERAVELYQVTRQSPYIGTGSFAQLLCDEIIQPNIERINKALGQENDPKFMAYVIEYALMTIERGSK